MWDLSHRMWDRPHTPEIRCGISWHFFRINFGQNSKCYLNSHLENNAILKSDAPGRLLQSYWENRETHLAAMCLCYWLISMGKNTFKIVCLSVHYRRNYSEHNSALISRRSRSFWLMVTLLHACVQNPIYFLQLFSRAFSHSRTNEEVLDRKAYIFSLC